MRSTRAGHHRCWSFGIFPNQRRDRSGIDGGRHHQQTQIGTNRVPGVERKRQTEVGVHGTFVELVEQHGAYPRQGRVALEPSGKDAFGNYFDARIGTDAAIVTGSPTHRVANGLAQHLCHSASHSASGHTAGFKHQNASGRPGLIEQA